MVRELKTRVYGGICEDVIKDGVYLQTYSGNDGVWNSTRSGGIWRGLKDRIKKSSYKDVVILFEDYQHYARWCNTQEEYFLSDEHGYYNIDKDILGDGKTYSEETCIFIPTYLNSILQGVGSCKRGESVGSSYYERDRNWRSYIVKDNRQISLGKFGSQEEAHIAWRFYKAKIVKEYLHENNVTLKIQNALLSLCDYLEN